MHFIGESDLWHAWSAMLCHRELPVRAFQTRDDRASRSIGIRHVSRMEVHDTL